MTSATVPVAVADTSVWIEPLVVRSTELYGALAELVRGQGRDPRPRRFDLLMAAIAARHGMPVLTRDRIGFGGLERVVTVIQVG